MSGPFGIPWHYKLKAEQVITAQASAALEVSELPQVSAVGSTQLADIRIGPTRLILVCIGSQIVWQPQTISALFNLYTDADSLPDPWINEIPYNILDPTTWYTAGVTGGAMRFEMPQGLVGWPAIFSSRYRNSNQTFGDDGWIEIQVANAGSAPSYGNTFNTQVYRRYSNDGSYDNGVGIDLSVGEISIVTRVGGTETLQQDCGPFVNGDVIRQTQAGNEFAVIVNGEQTGAWTDEGGITASGPAERSVGIYVSGTKDFLGPRRFSPSLSYIEAV